MILEYFFCFLVFWFWDKISCNWDWPWTHSVVEDDFELLICLSLLPSRLLLPTHPAEPWDFIWRQDTVAQVTPQPPLCPDLSHFSRSGFITPGHSQASPGLSLEASIPTLWCSYSSCLSWNRGLRASSDYPGTPYPQLLGLPCVHHPTQESLS